MPKQLRIKNVNSSFCLTVRELAPWLVSISPDQLTNDNKTPILLKCGGKNYRLSAFKIVGGKPVLLGKRSARD